MKKFTKGCLITALVLFLVGMIICGVGGLLGGFGELSEMDGIGPIPFRYYRNAEGDWRIGFFDGRDMEKLDNIEDMDNIVDRKLAELEGKKAQLALTADTLGSITIDLKECNLAIRESADEHVWISVDGSLHETRYAIEDGKSGKSALRIENETTHRRNYWKDNDMVCLWLPKDCVLEECEVDMGAGFMTSSCFLKTDQANITVGAGLLEAEGFESGEITILVGAGELIAERVTAQKADFEVGAGHLCVDELSVSHEADLSVNMGLCEITGNITGDLDLECDMGEAVLSLAGSQDDHSYEVECGMGEVVIGSYSHSGLATERSWNTGKASEFDINCNMGNVTITFDR